MKRHRTVGSVKHELVIKAKEAALCAIKIFNDPMVHFKTETFIVLMTIAWTYLLHAYYRNKGIDYRYHHVVKLRKRYDLTKGGAKKHWELDRCLNESTCPLDSATVTNLRFLIGLRNEIEHQMAHGLDDYLSGRYQACALNFNHYLKTLFGKHEGLDRHLAYTIQFAQLTAEQFQNLPGDTSLPSHLKAYIADFDGTLTHEQYNDPRYSFRLVFARKLVNRPGQADKVIEFIDPSSDLAKTIAKEYWVKKEVEKKKYLPKHVVEAVKAAGFNKYRIQPDHLEMWRTEDAKNLAKGYGADVAGQWYWYESWVKRCIQLCVAAGDKYK